MASAEQYADWIVNNADKKGSPEFDTVAAAYQAAKQGAGNPSQMKGSVAGGAFMGLRDPIDAGAQMVRRLVPEGVGRAVDNFGNMLADAGLPVARSSGVAGVDSIVKGANAEYDASRNMAGRDGLDVARIAGNIANPVNRIVPMAGATSTAAVAGRAGAQGAVSGLFQPVTNTEDFWSQKAGQVALGGAAGAAGGAAADKLMQGVGARFAQMRAKPGFPQMLGGKAQVPPQVQSAQTLAEAAQAQGIDLSAIPKSILDDIRGSVEKALKNGQTLDARSLVRQAEGRAVLGDDAGLMLGQSTRDPLMFARELDLRGIQNAGKPIADRLSLQNERLIDKVGKLGARGAPDSYDAGDAAIKSLQATDQQLSKAVTAAYNQFRQASGSTIDVPLQPLAQRLGEVLDTYGKENLPAAVLSKLNEYGLGGMKQTKVFDLLEADKLIKIINANLDPMKAPQAGALGALRKGLSEAIDAADVQSQGASGPAADMLKQALQMAKARFGLHEAVPALEAAAKDAAGKQAFVQRYITAKGVEPDTLKGLMKLMSPEATDAVRRNVMADILEKAAPGAGRGSDAAVFSQAGFNRALDSIGDRKLNLIFGAEGVKQLRQIGRVSEWMQKAPKGSAVNNSNTGAAVMNLLQGLGGKSDSPMLNRLSGLPVVNIVKNSLAQSLDESAARNALTANLRPTSPQLAPEEINALRPYLSLMGGAFGSAAASGLR